MRGDTKSFLITFGVGATVIFGMVAIAARDEVANPPDVGLNNEDVLAIAEGIRSDLNACRDTITALRYNLDKWQVEIHGR